MRPARVRYGQGAQTVRFIPNDAAGRPVRVTGAFYTIVDMDEGDESAERVIVASTAATLSSVSTTLSAAAGSGAANPRALTLTSPAGVVEGRTYLAATAAGRALVSVDNLTGSVVTAKSTPGVALPIGSTFQAIELEATFPALEANDPDAIDEGRRYQVIWEYTLQGEQWRTGQMVYLARYSGEPWITEADVILAFPTLPDRIRGKCTVGQGLAVAHQDLVAELESAGVRAEYYRGGEPGAVALRNRAIENCLRWCNSEQSTALADLYESRYQKMVASIITGKGGRAVIVDEQHDTAGPGRVDGLFNRG